MLSRNEKRVRDSELVKWIFNTEAETIRKRKFKLMLNAEKVTSNLIQR